MILSICIDIDIYTPYFIIYILYIIQYICIWIWSYDSWYILLYYCWCNCFKFPLKKYAIKMCVQIPYFSHSLVSQDWFHSWVFRCFYQNMKNSIQRILKWKFLCVLNLECSYWNNCSTQLSRIKYSVMWMYSGRPVQICCIKNAYENNKVLKCGSVFMCMDCILHV